MLGEDTIHRGVVAHNGDDDIGCCGHVGECGVDRTVGLGRRGARCFRANVVVGDNRIADVGQAQRDIRAHSARADDADGWEVAHTTADNVLRMNVAALLSVIAVATASPTPSPTPSALPVIGIVRVATGSLESLHQLPVPASVLDQQAMMSLPAITGDQILGNLPGFDRDRSNSMFTNYGQLRVSFAGLG